MNSIAISGSSGFVGRNLIKYFLEKIDFKINTIDARLPFMESQLYNVGIVIHLAGKAHDLKKTSDDQEYFIVNRDLTIKLFDLFLESEARDFIYFSSVKAVADVVENELFEEVVPEPKTPYGQSKQQAEAYLLSKQLPEGKRLFIIRPCMIHGPGNKGNLNLLYRVVKKGIPYPLAAFENKRSFLSIDNLNFIIARLISDVSIPGGVYNVADDIPLSTNEVIGTICEAEGKSSRLWKISRVLIKSIAAVGDIFHLPLNSERLKKLTESYVVNNDKIKKALNIYQLPVSSKDGLLKTIRSFR